MRELFVYFRVAEVDSARCETLVRDFQARLARDVPGLRARRLVRPEAPDGKATWMETYAVEGLGVDAALQTRIEAEAAVLAPLLDGPRHVEVFIARP